MKKQVLIEHFGGVQAVADLVGVTHVAVVNWPDVLTDRIFHRVIGAASDKGVKFPKQWLGKKTAA